MRLDDDRWAWDILGGGGAILVLVGVWQVSPWLFIAFLGAIKLALAIWGAKSYAERKARKAKEDDETI